MDERIRAQILSGEITALSLDTSVFEKAGLALESGLLAQLAQFCDGDVKLVLASTVANEVRRHLSENAEKALVALQTALRDVGRHQVLPADLLQRVMNDIGATKDVEAQRTRTRIGARQRFDHWVERTQANVVSEAEFASIEEVMRRYEASEPPFSATGNKKREFPDAVALSTLEGWANRSGSMILTVTLDNDWKRYGEQSTRLVMVDDLADALAAFQRRAEEAREVARRLAASLEEGDSFGLEKALLVALAEQDSVFEFHIQADSAHFSVQDEGVDVAFQVVEILDPDGFETVSYTGNKAVVKITAVTNADIDVHFSFESIDRDDESVHRTMISRIEPIEFEALVNVAIDAGRLSIDDVEILPVQHRMSFAELEQGRVDVASGEGPVDPDERVDRNDDTF